MQQGRHKDNFLEKTDHVLKRRGIYAQEAENESLIE